jgi:hypothetical protein
MATITASSNALEVGTVYKDPDVALVDLTASAENAPGPIASAMTAAATAVKSVFTAQQKKIATLTTVAEMQTATTKAKAKSEGREATAEELEESCGPLAFLTDGFKTLEEGLGKIYDGIGEFATDLGIAVEGFLGSAVDLVNEVFDKISGIANDIAQAIEDGLTAVAEALQNSPLGQLYQSISDKVGELTASLTNTINELAASALAAFDSALEKIEAFVDSISLSNLFSTDCANEAKEAVLNTDQLSTEAEVQTALAAPADQQAKSVDPKATEAPAPFAERAEAVPKAVEPTPTLQVAINKYREAQLARDATIQEAQSLITSGNRNPAQIADLKKRQGNANFAAGNAKSDLEDAAKFAGLRLGSLPIYGPSYNQPQGPITTYDPDVVARADAAVEDQTKRYVAAVREFDRANTAQYKELQSQKYTFSRTLTDEDFARHNALKATAVAKANAVREIIANVLPGDRPTVTRAARFTGNIDR